MTTINLGIKNKNLIRLDQEDILAGFDPKYAYEVIRLINTRPLFFDLHYERLVKTCECLKILPPKYEQILADVELICQKNQIQNNNIKIAVDLNNDALFPIPSKYPSKEDYLRGVSCSFLFEERENPEIKTFQADLREKSNKQISQQDIYESVLVNQKGFITEGSRSSLFFIRGNNIFTAPDHLVLPGITRYKVIELCKRLNINTKEELISIDNLSEIDAAFICGTSPGILPISIIDDYHFDVQNSVLQKIHNAYHSKYLTAK